MTATLDGHRLTKAKLELPYTGLWHADVSLDDPSVVSGTVPIVLGGLSLLGTIVSGDVYAGTAEYRVVGGAGGWRKTIKEKGYQNDAGVQLSLVLKDAATEVGEMVQLASGVDRALGPAYDRQNAPAVRTLSLLAQTPFWIDSAGVTQLGPRATGTVSSGFDLVHYDTTNRIALVASETPEVFQPGLTVELQGAPAVSVGSVVHMLEGGSIRTELYAATATEGERVTNSLRLILRELAPELFYRGVFEYRVVSQSGLRLELQPARSVVGLPPISRVQMRPGLAGGAAQLATGASVLVAFVDADPARPVVVAYTAPDDAAADPTALALANGNNADVLASPVGRVIRSGDTVSVGTAAGPIILTAPATGWSKVTA